MKRHDCEQPSPGKEILDEAVQAWQGRITSIPGDKKIAIMATYRQVLQMEQISRVDRFRAYPDNLEEDSSVPDTPRFF